MMILIFIMLVFTLLKFILGSFIFASQVLLTYQFSLIFLLPYFLWLRYFIFLSLISLIAYSISIVMPSGLDDFSSHFSLSKLVFQNSNISFKNVYFYPRPNLTLYSYDILSERLAFYLLS